MPSVTDLAPCRILLVDDDAGIRELLCRYLADFGMQTLAVANGRQMRQQLAQQQFDLVILDLMLPGDSGLVLARELRTKSSIPILMLTARGELSDRVVGLELGADDYLVKPFEPRELVARLNSILRRSRQQTDSHTGKRQFAGWSLDPLTRQLTRQDALVVPLSNAEFRLLSAFLDTPKKVLSREWLLDAARGRGVDMLDRSIDLLVSRLRQKLGDDPKQPHIIKTLRGEGYFFDAQIQSEEP